MAEIKFIGTGSGKTSLNRFHSSFLVSSSYYNLLIDAGDGASKALLSQGVDFTKIDGILFTHLHPDHYTGLAALIVQMKMYNREKQLDIFINSELVGVIKKFLINSYLFPERLGFSISYHKCSNDNRIEISNEISFIPRLNSHLKSISNLQQYKKQGFSCSSILLKLENKNIHYTGDIGDKSDLLLFKEFNPDVLISEITHIELNDIVDIFGEDKLPKNIIFSHISDGDELKIEKFLSDIVDIQKAKFITAHDGLEFTI